MRVCIGLFCAVSTQAQLSGLGPPGGPLGRLLGGPSSGSSTACDTCGDSATYAEEITTDSGYELRTITTSGCPNHYSLCTGKAVISACGGVGEEGTDTEASDQERVVEIPASPVIATSTSDVSCDMGILSVALNGVSIYSGAVDSSCTLLDVDEDASEWTGFDFCSGHSEMSGDYHYHFPPSCLINQIETAQGVTGVDHSPHIAWAFDGFPVYGPRGVNGTHMEASCDDDDVGEFF